jgi:hypothetical protein
MLGCVLAGVVGLLSHPTVSNPVDFYLSHANRIGYYTCLIVAGIVVLTGSRFHKVRDVLVSEMIGLWLLCGPLLVYPIALFAFVGAPTGVGASIACVIGIGCLARIVQIYLELKRLRAVTE